jgi:hypothetical protein
MIIPKILECLNSSNQCPVTHLNVYCNKIAEVVYDDKLLLHFFQDNLSDAALTWYIRLGNTKVKKSKDLVDFFIKQYKFNMDVGPDRSSLQAIKEDNNESIREYAQRWREATSQVNTFKAPYFEYLVESFAQHFSDPVAIAERFEQVIWLGRIADSTEEKSFTGKRKETDVHNIKSGYKGERKNYQNKDI